MKLFWAVSKVALLHSFRSVVYRYRGIPVILALPVLAWVLWYVSMAKLYGAALLSTDEAANQLAVTAFTGAFVLVATTSGMLSRLHHESCLVPGTRALPVPQGIYLAVETAGLAAVGTVVGTMTTIPFATSVLLPKATVSEPRILAAYALSLVSWCTATLIGVAWAHWSWAAVVSTGWRVNDFIMHLAGAVMFAGGFLLLGALSVALGPTVVSLPVWAITNTGLPVVELLAAFLGVILAASATDLSRRAPVDMANSWVPLTGTPRVLGAWPALALLTIRRIMRDAASTLTAAVIPLVLLGIAVAVRLLPSLSPLIPPLFLSSLYIIPTSFASIVLSTDLFTLSSQWLLALPTRTITLAISESTASTAIAVIPAAAFSVVCAVILGISDVTNAPTLVILVAMKTVSLAGVGLLLTCTIHHRDGESTSAILLGLLFAIGTALVEGLLYWLPQRIHIAQGAIGAMLACGLFSAGVTCRWAVCFRRTQHGLVDR